MKLGMMFANVGPFVEHVVVPTGYASEYPYAKWVACPEARTRRSRTRSCG